MRSVRTLVLLIVCAGALLLANAAVAQSPPHVGQATTYTSGVLVWLVLPYSDSDSDADGFEFRGVNGSGWAPESHPFTSPSFGKVYPDRVEYPFNHACGTASQIDSYVQAWIYDATGLDSNRPVVHLVCGGDGG